MKRTLIECLLIASALGVVQITFNIPNHKAQDILTAFTAQQDSAVTIQIQGSQGAGNPGVEDYSARLQFRTPVRDPNEGDKQFTKRMQSRIISAFSQAHKQKVLLDIKEVYDANAPDTDVSEPNGIE